MDSFQVYDEESEEPPSRLDTFTGVIPAVGVFLWQIFRYINGVDFICPIRGSGLRRCSINL